MVRTTHSNDKYYLGSVGNAFDVLGVLSERGEAGISELGKELSLSKAAIFRLLYTMKSKGFVHEDMTTKKYRLGYRLFTIGTRVRDQDLMGQQLTPFLQDLAAESGETANVGIPEGSEVVHVNTVISSQALRLDVKIGEREPLYSTALGKILLADMSEEDVRARLGTARLRRLTPNTITSLSALKVELQTIRKQGYAIDNEESYPEIRCVAVPLRDSSGHVIAALSISGPASRLPLEKVPAHLPMLSRTSAAIEAFLRTNLPEGFGSKRMGTSSENNYVAAKAR